MNAKDDALTAGVDRLNALLGWWGARQLAAMA